MFWRVPALQLCFELIDTLLQGFKRFRNRGTHAGIRSAFRQRQIHLHSLVIRHGDSGSRRSRESVRLRTQLILPRVKARDYECAIAATHDGEIRTIRNTVHNNLCLRQRLAIGTPCYASKGAGCILISDTWFSS